MDTYFLTNEKKILSEVSEADRNAIKDILWPHFIGGALVLNQFQLNYEKSCFIRIYYEGIQTHNNGIKYYLHSYNVQLLWIELNEIVKSDTPVCGKETGNSFRRLVMTNNEVEKELEKIFNFHIDINSPNERVNDCLESLSKLFYNNIFLKIFEKKVHEKYSDLFHKILLSLLDISSKFLNPSKSDTKWPIRSDNSEIQIKLIYIIDCYLRLDNDDVELIASKLIDKYLDLLQSNDDNICYYAVLAFTKLIKHCEICCRKCIQTDLSTKLLALFKPNISLTLLRVVIHPFFRLTVFEYLKKPLNNERLLKEFLKVVDLLIDHNDEHIVSLVTSEMLILTQYREVILESKVMVKFIPLLVHQNQEIQNDSLRILDKMLINFMSEKNKAGLFAKIFSYELYLKLREFLNSDDFVTKSVSLSIFALIIYENAEQIQLLIDANIIPALIDVISNSINSNKKLGIIAIDAIIRISSEEQISYIYSKGIIPTLADSLDFYLNNCNIGNCVRILNILSFIQNNCNKLKINILKDMADYGISEKSQVVLAKQ
jgi:hypothetical protein